MPFVRTARDKYPVPPTFFVLRRRREPLATRRLATNRSGPDYEHQVRCRLQIAVGTLVQPETRLRLASVCPGLFAFRASAPHMLSVPLTTGDDSFDNTMRTYCLFRYFRVGGNPGNTSAVRKCQNNPVDIVVQCVLRFGAPVVSGLPLSLRVGPNPRLLSESNGQQLVQYIPNWYAGLRPVGGSYEQDG